MAGRVDTDHLLFGMHGLATALCRLMVTLHQLPGGLKSAVTLKTS